jgi:hypothetical protein
LTERHLTTGLLLHTLREDTISWLELGFRRRTAKSAAPPFTVLSELEVGLKNVFMAFLCVSQVSQQGEFKNTTKKNWKKYMSKLFTKKLWEFFVVHALLAFLCVLRTGVEIFMAFLCLSQQGEFKNTTKN